MFISHSFFFIGYRAGDKDVMFLPSYLIWAIWCGFGFQWLIRWVEESNSKNSLKNILLVIISGIIIIGVLFSVAWNWRFVDLSTDWSTRNRGESILDQLEPNAMIFGYWDTVPVIEYLQFVEGQRSDVTAINRYLIPSENMEILIKNSVVHRPVYIDRIPANLIDEMDFQENELIYRVLPQD